MAETAPVRAKLSPKESGTGGDVEFSFNPTEYTLTAASSWKQTPAKGKSKPKTEFTGTLPMTMAFDAIFVENWKGRDGLVSVGIQGLLEFTQPTDASVAKGKPQPPVLIFDWGGDTPIGDCHLKSVTLKAQMFDDKGMITRATASIVLEEVLAEPAKQNPTSGGPPGNRAHIVAEGDSLASIAFREYDDAALWRGLAALNGIDDPMRLAIGRRLIVPPFAQVAERS